MLIPFLWLMVSMVHGDDDLAQAVEKATALTSSLFMIEGGGGNITASIGPDGTLLVDDDFAAMSGKLVAKLKELKGGSPRFIVSTHFHYDHTGGNEVFGATATILAPTALRARLTAEQTLWRKPHPPAPSSALPQVTFERELKLHLNEDEIRLVHLPRGHTDGDTVVLFTRGNVASLGDLYFSGMYPIFHPEHGGSLTGVVRNLEWVLKETNESTRFVPGHGPLSGRTELLKYHRMILASLAAVRKGMRKGQSLAQIQKVGLAAEWEPFSHGYRSTDQWLASVYESLQAEGPGWRTAEKKRPLSEDRAGAVRISKN